MADSPCIDKPRVCVTRPLAGDWRALLEGRGCHLVPVPAEDRPLTREEFLGAIQGCHAVGGMLTEKWDAEAFEAAGPQLLVVANYAVGFNNIDLDEARRRGVVVTNTPDVLTEATADIAWGLLMAAARHFHGGEKLLRSGHWNAWGPNQFLGVDLVGRTLGIIGPGRIGAATARRSRGWNMRVVYTHPRGKPEFEQEAGATRVDLDTLLRESDFVSIHTPLTPETRHLIGARELALMKPTAILVNTARGAVVDEAALVRALRDGSIFAAGLDVYENEPRITPGLAELENVFLLPHVGSATIETRSRMAMMVAENIVAVLDGRRAPNRVA